MPSLSTTYLIPALLLNPAFVLHLINTTMSYFTAPLHNISLSPHPFMDSLGPKRETGLYMDMHADDALCWRYTAVMVVVQILAIGRVQENREQKRARREAKRAERLERVERERVGKTERERGSNLSEKENERVHIIGELNANGCKGMDGVVEVPAWEDKSRVNRGLLVDEIEFSNGGTNRKGKREKSESENSSEESLTETSEEEMIV